MKTLNIRIVLLLLTAGFGACSASEERPDIEGIYDPGMLTSFDDPRWPVEDLNCPFPCTVSAREYLTSLLNDPANSQRELLDLRRDGQQYNVNYIHNLLTDSAKERVSEYSADEDDFDKCEPHGWVHVQAQPLPIKIEQLADRVLIHYDYWKAVRTIFTDGRDFPEELKQSPLGYSIGRYDGSSLLVETRGIEAKTVRIDGMMGLRNSDAAIVTERMTKRHGGDILEINLTVVDPGTFREPLVASPAFLSVPDAELGTFDCSTSTGDRLDELDE